jgi:hypothetical protein
MLPGYPAQVGSARSPDVTSPSSVRELTEAEETLRD